VAGAGAPRGLPGERPPSGGGGGREAASAGTWSTSARRRRPASPVPASTAGPRPGRRAPPPRVGLRRHRPGHHRSETRGRGGVPHRVPGGPVLRLRRIRDAGPVVPHTSAPPWRVRALPEGEPAVVEARIVVRHDRSAAGRAPSEVSQVAAEIGLQAADCSGTESSVTVTRGRGRPVAACSRWGGGRRPAAGCRGRATAFGQARACAYLGSGEQVLTGTSSGGSPGTWFVAPAREIRGSDTTTGHRGP
jgi:hypothetical protein